MSNFKKHNQYINDLIRQHQHQDEPLDNGKINTIAKTHKEKGTNDKTEQNEQKDIAETINELQNNAQHLKQVQEKQKLDIDISHVYRITCKNVEKVLREYTDVGPEGQLSIQQLYEMYRTKWGNSQSLKKKYSREKMDLRCNEKKGLSKGYTEEECFKLLENAIKKHRNSLASFMDFKDLFPDELK